MLEPDFSPAISCHDHDRFCQNCFQLKYEILGDVQIKDKKIYFEDGTFALFR